MKQDHVARFMAEMPDIVSAQPQIIYIDAQDVRGFGPMGRSPPAGPESRTRVESLGRRSRNHWTPKVLGPGGMRQESYAAPLGRVQTAVQVSLVRLRAVSHCSAGRFRGASSEFHVEVHVVRKAGRTRPARGDLTHLGESRD